MFEWINSGFGPAIRIALLVACVFQAIALPAESVAVRDGVGHGLLVLRTPDGKPPEIMVIGANDGARNLVDIYVVFPRNIGTTRADHHDGWTSNLPIVLSRSGTSIIDVSSKLERKPQ